MKDAAEILRSARVAELKLAADEVARLCRQPASVPVSRRSRHRLLVALLARERRRAAALAAELAR